MGPPAPAEALGTYGSYGSPMQAPTSSCGNDASGIGTVQTNSSHNSTIGPFYNGGVMLFLNQVQEVQEVQVQEQFEEFGAVTRALVRTALERTGVSIAYNQSAGNNNSPPKQYNVTIDPNQDAERESILQRKDVFLGYLPRIGKLVVSFRSNEELMILWQDISEEGTKFRDRCLSKELSHFMEYQSLNHFNKRLKATLVSARHAKKYLSSMQYLRRQQNNASSTIVCIEYSRMTIEKLGYEAHDGDYKPGKPKRRTHKKTHNPPIQSWLTNAPAESTLAISPERMLREKLVSLQDNIKDLTKHYEELCKRHQALSILRSANHTHMALYNLLCNRCSQHNAHTIEFDLEAELKEGEPSAVTFRFSAIIKAPKQEVICLTVKPPLPAYSYSLQRGLSCLSSYNSQHRNGTTEPHLGGTLICDKSYVQMNDECSLTQLNHEIRREFEEKNTLRLAKQIATAVAKFGYTPWLTTFWKWENVVFFGAQRGPIYKPYFRIHLETAKHRNRNFSNSDTGRMLFCLGLVLYHLWKYIPGILDPEAPPIYEPPDDELDPESIPVITMDTNKQIDDWVHKAKMPVRYADIIRWCLNAPNYPVAEMSDSRKLAEMYVKVICGLEIMEQLCTGDMTGDMSKLYQ